MVTLAPTKLFSKACLTVGVIALIAQTAFPQTPRPAPPAQRDEAHQLWSTIVEPILLQSIKSGEQGQNFGTTMMVPLQAAFRLRDVQWEQDFADHFSRMVANFASLPDEDLGRLQYLYVASQFMVLAKHNGQLSLIPRTLPGTLYTDLWKVWTGVAIRGGGTGLPWRSARKGSVATGSPPRGQELFPVN